MDRLTLTYLMLMALVPMIQCNPMSDREAEVMRKVDLLKSIGAIADRDMHAWWAEFDTMMADYQSKRDAAICTEEDMLANFFGCHCCQSSKGSLWLGAKERATANYQGYFES